MDDQTGTMALDSQLCFSVYSTSIAINRLYRPLLDTMGITYPQYLVLSTLWETDGRSIGAIADRLALESSTITPLVKRLEQAGFLARQRCNVDERLVYVRLTEKGRALQAKTVCLKDAMVEKSGMSAEEFLRLNKDVQRLLGALVKKDEVEAV
jgi:DNA-binding MarR family transcriptional regulator